MAAAAPVRLSLPQREIKFKLPEAWPIYCAFLGFPLWYVLGFAPFMLPVFALPMLFSLLMRGRVEIPRGLGLWFLFVGWTLVTALRLDTGSRILVFGYRTSLYLAATVFFIFVFNVGERTRAWIVRAMAAFFVIVVVFGIVDMAAPSLSIHTLAESLLPKSISANSWVHSLVVARFAQVQALVYGQAPVARPTAPFAYTNDWGSTYSLLFPFAIAAALTSHRFRVIMWVAIGISVVPLVASGNRGAWLTVVVALTYAAIRYAMKGRVKILAGLIAAMILGAILITLTPLGAVVMKRAIHTNSNRGRLTIYRLAADGVRQSPIFGFGAPRPSTDPSLPDIGTHGQIWMILYSHGLPGAILYIAFLVVALLRTRRASSISGVWLHITVFSGLIQMLFYQALPNGLFVIMIAAALAWSERLPEIPPTQPVEVGRLAPIGVS